MEASDAKYASKPFDIFLQGSYGNDTNIFADSDVDIVILTDSLYYYDTSLVPVNEQLRAKAAMDGIAQASFSWHQFYSEVKDALVKSFGNAVEPGQKAIRIAAGGSRRNADVLVATEFRRYRRFPTGAVSQHDLGLCFFDQKGTGSRIANFPKQHSKNCTAKHHATQQRFKPMVRILKNLRGKLVSDGLLNDGVAPSYFLEGLLYNVPNSLFVTSYQDTFINAFNWIVENDRSKFICANAEYYLFGESSVNWRTANCDAFLDAVKRRWDSW